MDDAAELVVAHRYRCREGGAGGDELVLALYRRRHRDGGPSLEVRVTQHEGGREAGMAFTATLADRGQARRVWAERVRWLRDLGYARVR